MDCGTLVEHTIDGLGDHAENGLLTDVLVRDGDGGLAVGTGSLLREDGVDLSPVALGSEVGGDAVQPGRLGMGESGTNGIAIDMEVIGLEVVGARSVATARSFTLTIIVERLDGGRVLDGVVGVNATRKEQHHGCARDLGKHGDFYCFGFLLVKLAISETSLFFSR